MFCNPLKCKEINFRQKGFIQDIMQVNNIPQCMELPMLGVMFQENGKYSEHVRARLIKANKCLFVLRLYGRKVSVKVKWTTYLAP